MKRKAKETPAQPPHVCVHCEGGGCTACNRTGVCGSLDLFEDTGRRIRNLASKMDVILFNLKMKNEAERKALIEDVFTLQCFHLAAYGQPNALLEKYISGLEDNSAVEEKDERKDSGSYFTPPVIADYIVDGTVGKGIAEIKKDKRIKNKIAKILAYRICDPAVGGGIFLVCAHDRLMKEILMIDPNADLETLSAKVATSCLFGVDINPAAIEGCKLALHLNIAKWRLKKKIEEFANIAAQSSGSQNAKCDNNEKPSSAQEPAQGASNTQKTTRTKEKKRRAKRVGRSSKSRTGTEPKDSAQRDVPPQAGSENQGST